MVDSIRISDNKRFVSAERGDLVCENIETGEKTRVDIYKNKPVFINISDNIYTKSNLEARLTLGDVIEYSVKEIVDIGRELGVYKSLNDYEFEYHIRELIYSEDERLNYDFILDNLSQTEKKYYESDGWSELFKHSERLMNLLYKNINTGHLCASSFKDYFIFKGAGCFVDYFEESTADNINHNVDINKYGFNLNDKHTHIMIHETFNATLYTHNDGLSLMIVEMDTFDYTLYCYLVFNDFDLSYNDVFDGFRAINSIEDGYVLNKVICNG